MSGMWGRYLQLSIFGESHGGGIGVNISGLPAGFPLDMEAVGREMERRAPGRNRISTARREADVPEILSGVFNGRTTGAPLCALIRNTDTRSQDYGNLAYQMRPGHSDYPASVRYGGFNDYRGGGHFSGRLTAPLVFAGAVARQILAAQGIRVGGHLLEAAGVEDDSFDPVQVPDALLERLHDMEIPLIREERQEAVRQAILEAKTAGDSVGGIVECAVTGLPAGVGDPFFDSVESTLAQLLFSVPAVKGVAFGSGFGMARMRGSVCNDPYYYDGEGRVRASSNHNGGLLGGITDGMPVLFTAAIKPTASIALEQQTVNLREHRDDRMVVRGRHDPCIAVRAVPVLEAVAAIGMLDQLKGCGQLAQTWKE